jgi:hypothetical protein
MFGPLHAGLALAVVTLFGAAQQETMQTRPPGGPPPQESYPRMEQVAQRVIQHYQTLSCQALEQERSQPPAGQKAQMEQRTMQVLRNDPQMRTAFLNRAAAPIANKLFECDMIP